MVLLKPCYQYVFVGPCIYRYDVYTLSVLFVIVARVSCLYVISVVHRIVARILCLLIMARVVCLRIVARVIRLRYQ